MLEEQKIYGSQFLTDCSPESLKNLYQDFSIFLRKLDLSPPSQAEWLTIFKEATNNTSTNELITAWTLRGDQIYLEIFHPSSTDANQSYHHENVLSPHGMRQIVSKSYNKINTLHHSQNTSYELEIASEFQKKILPLPNLPENQHWSLFTRRKSSLNLAGDYVDAYQNKNGDLFLITADIMGKGITAALLASIIKTAFDINLESNITLLDLIHSLNHIIVRETKNLTIFATCSIAFIPSSYQHIEIVNAGHCPPPSFQ